MKSYQTGGDLAPRDVVSRAMLREAWRTHHPCVYLSLEGLNAKFIKERFPLIRATCLQYKLDITQERIPVFPAAHYMMGGVAVDLEGRTTLENLFAAGEVAANGVHGANRLASNSILEGLVFGARAARAMAESKPPSKPPVFPSDRFGEPYILPETKRDLLTLAWDKVGVFRNRRGLERSLEHLDRLDEAMRGRFLTHGPRRCKTLGLTFP